MDIRLEERWQIDFLYTVPLVLRSTDATHRLPHQSDRRNGRAHRTQRHGLGVAVEAARRGAQPTAQYASAGGPPQIQAFARF
jgi:hypothetical protein